MFDVVGHLTIGLSAALSLENLLYCLIGALVGTLVGVLPGFGPLAAISMLLPATFGLPPTGALIMLAGIYYGAQYGGSTTSILVNIPGEASSVMTAIDGHKMARQGRAGAALAVAAIGSFIAGTFATFVVALLAQPMTALALLFGPWEYFSLVTLALVCTVAATAEGGAKNYAMLFLGLLLSMVGADPASGIARMGFGIAELYDGISFVVVAMALFGFAEILRTLNKGSLPDATSFNAVRSYALEPGEGRRSVAAIARGTGVGSVLGILPGGGAVMASFVSYLVEKWAAREPERFGKGAIEGVAGPESANNAAAQTSFIPMLTLGIPSNPVMALMVGALVIHGIVPGPQIMSQQSALFWTAVASMWVANVLLLVINLPFIGVWVKVLKIPYRHLFPLVILFCCIGLYSVNNSIFDVLMAALFGAAGCWLLLEGYEPAPLLFGLVLGPLLERNLSQAWTISAGNPWSFLTRPISGSLLAVAGILVLAGLYKGFRATRSAESIS